MREFGRSHCMNAHKIERVIPTKTDIAFEFISFILVLQKGFLTLWKHCHKLDLCTSSRPSHLHEAH